ncbi:conserved hypothetical protein [Shewanella sediminis HAW-EB3]|uniref:Lipoprotein n=1 Tax=Shewanella sediminis (strain HAW-EB3) TaxID=425104 RepID=A8FS21_SHESH|nr:hypothetical protein [Shewanella sediminis]ABV35644.1 conserved hypothetical protein [Shewanella sediminis HAW-EB3]
MNRVSDHLLIVLAILFMTTQLSGCNHTEDSNIDPTEAQVAQSVKEAQLLGDLRLYATTGRRATLPGISQEESEQAKTVCGVQYMTGTGDAISTTEQREKRKQLIDFMTSYNRVIFEMCKKKLAD